MTSIVALIGCGQEVPYGREESIPGSYRDPASPKSIEKPASRETGTNRGGALYGSLKKAIKAVLSFQSPYLMNVRPK